MRSTPSPYPGIDLAQPRTFVAATGISGSDRDRAIAFDRMSSYGCFPTKKKAFNTKEDAEDASGHGGSRNALRAKRYLFPSPWPTVVLDLSPC